MKRRTVLFSIILSFFLLPGLWAAQGIQINTGHTQSINDYAVQRDKGLLHSVGNDGTLRVWDIGSYREGRGALLHKLQISHLPIVKVAVHPTESQVALVETDRINTFHLSVWDYETDTELFSHKIDEVPLFLSYSPQGTYLMYGKTEWKSIMFLDSQSGELQPVLDQGFGIVSSLFLSSSEKTLLTYSPSGMLRYWTLTTGEEKTSFSTLGDLADVQFSTNGVYMTGVKTDTLYLINLVTGAIESQKKFQSIRGYSLDPGQDRIVVYFLENSRPRFQSFRIEKRNNSRFLSEAGPSYSAPDFAAAPLVVDGGRIYFCRDNGEMYVQSIYNANAVLFSSSVLLKVSGLSLSGDSLVIAGRDHILKLRSAAFSQSDTAGNTSFSYSTERFDNPIKAETGIYPVSSNRFLVYPRSGTGKTLYLFDGTRFTPLDIPLSSPVQMVSGYENEILLLEKNGKLRVIDPFGERELFSYSSFGLQSAVESFNKQIVLARNQTDLINTTLLSVNPETSETVPIPDRNLLTFNLAYDNVARTLYSLGFENRRGSIRTVLKAHQGSALTRVSTLLSYPGEDNEASLAVDPETSRLFTSLGYGDVHMFTWDGFTTMEQVEHIPRSLYAHSGMLYSLNGDSSISIWNIMNGKVLMNLYVFEDLSWVVSFTDGTYHATREANQWINRLE